MCEALYALPGGVVQPRRKPVALPLLVTIAGVAMKVANAMLPKSVEYANLKSALVLF